jgi:tetratricopeptide (TPR) repeat protein
LLDRAEAIGGLEASRALWQDRADYLARLGQAEAARAARTKAEQTPPAGARDHYLLACAHARRGSRDGYRRALAELDRALDLNPRHYWAWVQRGLCHQELKEYVLASGDFGTCIGLWPEFAWGYFSRGWLLDHTGRKADAVADYSAALKRDPALAPAYVNRGLARLELKRHGEALADFDQALALGKDDAAVHAGRGIALEAAGRPADADAAFRTALARAAGLARPHRERILWTYAFAVSGRLPEKSRAAFDEVLRHNVAHPQALYGRGLLAAEAGQPDEALRFFHRAVAADPGFVVARRYRGLMLARTGQFKPAQEDINWCLEREPQEGRTLYTAACIAARAAGAYEDPQAAAQALDFLAKALARGVERAQAADDEDLAGIRSHPQFRRLITRGDAAVDRQAEKGAGGTD